VIIETTDIINKQHSFALENVSAFSTVRTDCSIKNRMFFLYFAISGSAQDQIPFGLQHVGEHFPKKKVIFN